MVSFTLDGFSGENKPLHVCEAMLLLKEGSEVENYIEMIVQFFKIGPLTGRFLSGLLS